MITQITTQITQIRRHSHTNFVVKYGRLTKKCIEIYVRLALIRQGVFFGELRRGKWPIMEAETEANRKL